MDTLIFLTEERTDFMSHISEIKKLQAEVIRLTEENKNLQTQICELRNKVVQIDADRIIDSAQKPKRARKKKEE